MTVRQRILGLLRERMRADPPSLRLAFWDGDGFDFAPAPAVTIAILEADRDAPMKQRHSAKRIIERLRDEHGFLGGYTVVKDYVRVCWARSRETFVPLSHPPGHGQVDFGEALAVIGGVRQKIHFFCLDLPQSDACFVKA